METPTQLGAKEGHPGAELVWKGLQQWRLSRTLAARPQLVVLILHCPRASLKDT